MQASPAMLEHLIHAPAHKHGVEGGGAEFYVIRDEAFGPLRTFGGGARLHILKDRRQQHSHGDTIPNNHSSKRALVATNNVAAPFGQVQHYHPPRKI